MWMPLSLTYKGFVFRRVSGLGTSFKGSYSLVCKLLIRACRQKSYNLEPFMLD